LGSPATLLGGISGRRKRYKRALDAKTVRAPSYDQEIPGKGPMINNEETF